MMDPYEVFGVASDCDDETIRRRYLELVRQYSPEHQPQRFAAIRSAYESLRDPETRLRHRLFEAGKKDTIDAILETLTCRTPRRRVSLKMLLSVHHKP